MAGTSLRWTAEEQAGGDNLGLVVAALNIVGSALVGWLSGRGHKGSSLWAFAAIGFGGGLTTFSSYAVDTARRLDGQDLGSATGVGAGTVILALGAAVLARTWAARSVAEAHR